MYNYSYIKFILSFVVMFHNILVNFKNYFRIQVFYLNSLICFLHNLIVSQSQISVDPLVFCLSFIYCRKKPFSFYLIPVISLNSFPPLLLFLFYFGVMFLVHVKWWILILILVKKIVFIPLKYKIAISLSLPSCDIHNGENLSSQVLLHVYHINIWHPKTFL